MKKRYGLLFFVLFFVSSVFALTGDFDDDGSVGFGDFLLFAQGFNEFNENGSYSEIYDLNNDSNITVLDFFIFAESYDQVDKNVSGSNLTKPIALSKPVNLQFLDVNKDSCVDEEDIDFATLHIRVVAEKLLRMGEYWEFTPNGYVLNTDNQRAHAMNTLLFNYDFDNDGYVVNIQSTDAFLMDAHVIRNNFNCVNKNKNYGICESYFGDERNKCLILLASDVSDYSLCDGIEDSGLNEINLKKVCLGRFIETSTALALSNLNRNTPGFKG